MHPAPSVIVFTVLTGFGFAALSLLSLNIPNVNGIEAIYFYVPAFTFAVIGLIASTFHLGNPQRAWKAFSQFQTSWLSREGVFSICALIFCALIAVAKIFAQVHPMIPGVVASASCVLTILATAMIYAQLKTIPRWNTFLTPIIFFLSAYGGGLIMTAQILAAICSMTALLIFLWIYWLWGDGAFKRAGHTIETATGLGEIGKTKQFEPPHTGDNYLLSEMVYVVGRKHARKLRIFASLFACILPVGILFFAPITATSVLISFCLHICGLFIARWLFFAEAEHVVGLYYDQR